MEQKVKSNTHFKRTFLKWLCMPSCTLHFDKDKYVLPNTLGVIYWKWQNILIANKKG